ncbi:ABC transporter permease [Desertifilum sp. FACHB-1129]|nr:ABC transporter permease [Desertifilum tharense]MBD2311476.1 ABC transporter permease [Desertifilum sp. FACHB-1129]MBD2323352.1 ABC transporter permease [Desertifilum sp. FACHB-866]MBD2333197.1 ABC transporter permease [Desertifilum sp. FACHB-868]
MENSPNHHFTPNFSSQGRRDRELGWILPGRWPRRSLTYPTSSPVRREQIESLLALGVTRWEAAHNIVTEALRTGMIPTINSMMVMGIVSLPGMMTGQILAGATPTDAVRYQIVILFAIAAGTALTTISIILLAFFSLFSPNHQLRLDRLRPVKS